MLPRAFISHQSKGRMRIKVPSKKSDSRFLTKLKDFISGTDGVRSVELNPLTGSVLIIHDLEGTGIIDFLKNSNLLSFQWLNKKGNEMPGIQRRITDIYKSVNKQMMTSTGGELDISGFVFLALLGVAIYQMQQGHLGLESLPLFIIVWYLLNILWYEWHMPDNTDSIQ